jgi:CysZ protein
MYARNPRLVLLGVLPALIAGLLCAVGYATLIYFSTDLAAWVTPFADDWSEWTRNTIRVLAVIGLLGLGGLLGVLTFTSVTLLIGTPFYDQISAEVERQCGGVPDEVEASFWRSLWHGVVDSLRLLGLSLLIAVPLFLGGFIPVLGQTVIPVLGAVVGGWFLALELVGTPFYQRGLRLPDRRRVLRANRPMTLGFGVTVFLCFLIPLGAVLIMPAAVVGATLLTRRSFGQPIGEK